MGENDITERSLAGLVAEECEALVDALKRNDPELSTLTDVARAFLECKRQTMLYQGVMEGRLAIHPGKRKAFLPSPVIFYERDDWVSSARLRRRLRKARLRARGAVQRFPRRRTTLPKAQGPGTGANGPSDGANDA